MMSILNSREFQEFQDDFSEIPVDVLRKIIEILECHNIDYQNEFIERCKDILSITETPHNWLSEELEAFERSDGQKGVRIKNTSQVSAGKLIAMFGGKIHDVESFLHLDPEISMGHIMIGKQPILTIGAWSKSSVDAGDYINHSCDPNCEVFEAIGLRSIRNIDSGEEVTFDYGKVIQDIDIHSLPDAFPKEMIDVENNCVIFEWSCNCGATNCRGKISSKDF